VTWLDGFQRVTYAHAPGLPSWPIRGVVFHTTEGSTFEGADSVYRRTNAAPHFTVDPWRELRVQHIDTDLGAYALRNLPGGVETNTTGVVQIEVVGYTAEGVAASHGRPQFGISKLSEWNYRWLGEMVLRPILEAHPTIPRSIYVDDRMSGAGWMAWPGGLCAHAHVPENDHWDGSTLDFEQMLAHASVLTPQGDDMPLTQADIDAIWDTPIPLGSAMYPARNVLGFIHAEITRQDLLVKRIADAVQVDVEAPDTVNVVALVDELGRRLSNG
jgi:hypothetical protein